MKILLAPLLLVSLLACEAPSAPAAPAPKVVVAEPAPSKTAGPGQDAYIKAAIQMSCAGQSVTDTAELAKKISAIQKAAGFDPASWSSMAKEVGKDPAAIRRISDGATKCAE